MTIHQAFESYDSCARVRAFKQGPINGRTIYAPISAIKYCENGDVWLSKGWYARKKPTRICQARITYSGGKLSVSIPRALFSRMEYKDCLDVDETWKIDNLHFIKNW